MSLGVHMYVNLETEKRKYILYKHTIIGYNNTLYYYYL